MTSPRHDTVAPLDSAARITRIDALRGTALFGILIANVRQMFLPWDVASFDVPSASSSVLGWLDWGFFDALVDTKFITLFSLLFGISFALQFDRLEERSADFAGIYLRRLAVLALFGLLHGIVLYPAEVLAPYAVAGLMLFAVRGFSTDNLYRIGLVLLGTTVVWGFQIGALGRVSMSISLATLVLLAITAKALWSRSWQVTLVVMSLVIAAAIVALLVRWPPDAWGTSVTSEYAAARQHLAALRSAEPSSWPREFMVRQQDSFTALLRLHVAQYSSTLTYFGVLLVWRTLGLFMIGAALLRSGVIENTSVSTWQRVSVIGLAIGLPASLIATILQGREIQGLSDWRWPEWLHVFSAFPLAIGFGSRVLLNELRGRRRWWYGPIESAGRMALSNYVGQSLVMAALAESWGFGLYGKLGGPALTALACGVFFGLAMLSHAWLQHFRMGPLEWLWRCGTYWRWLPLRRAT
jgi:uncharacterized protein